MEQLNNVFATDLGIIQLVSHDIKMASGATVNQLLYQDLSARRHAIKAEVESMLQHGIIEKSSSPCSSPIMTGPKPDNTIYLSTTSGGILTFESFHLPRVDDLVDRLRKAWFINNLDLLAGAPNTGSKEENCLKTDQGHWQYRALLFGLLGASATFQRLMDIVL